MWSCKLWTGGSGDGYSVDMMPPMLTEVPLNSGYVLQIAPLIGEKKNIYDIVHYEIA